MRAPSLIEVCSAEDGRARVRELARMRECVARGVDPARATWAPLPWERELDQARYRYAFGGLGLGLPTLSIGISGAPWTPLRLPRLALWLRADMGVTLNGSTVSAWADQSGNGRNFSQATAAAQPTFNSTGLNSKAALSFVTDDWLQLASGPALTGGITMCVAVNATTGGYLNMLALYDASGSGAFELRDSGGADAQIVAHNDGGGSVAYRDGVTDINNANRIITATYNPTSPGTAALRINGVNESSAGSDGARTMPAASKWTIGSRHGASLFANMRLGEVVICAGVLNSADMASLERYMGSRYGITVP